MQQPQEQHRPEVRRREAMRELLPGRLRARQHPVVHAAGHPGHSDARAVAHPPEAGEVVQARPLGASERPVQPQAEECVLQVSQGAAVLRLEARQRAEQRQAAQQAVRQALP